MIKIETSSSNKKSKRTGTRKTAFALAFFVAAFAASGVSYGAKPLPALNATVCDSIGGVWTTNTCTVEGTSSVVNSGFRISNGIKLDIKGGLTISTGVTIANSGTIVVENAGGVIPGTPLNDWETGILLYGTLTNSGAITIANVYDETNLRATEGITVSDTVSATDWNDPTTFVVVPGALTNSGTITIQNGRLTRGIENLGVLTNSAPGTIAVENTGTSSVGIYNRRFSLWGSQYYIDGTLTNAGDMTVSSSGDSNSGTQYGYGIYNAGLLANVATGTFTINPSPALDDAGGLYNSGSYTNFGTFVNDRGSVDVVPPTWGSFNYFGTMNNFGTTLAKGTFYNNLIMVNHGTATSYGVLYDESLQLTMLNYGTFYNYGTIVGGTNKAICIDETSVNPEATGC